MDQPLAAMKCANCSNLSLDHAIQPHQLPPTNLLHSHVVATEIDKHNAKRAILDIGTQVSQIDDSVARLNKVVEKLTQERCRLLDERCSLMTSLEGHRSIVAPIRRVPDDVLSEIFKACLPAKVSDWLLDVSSWAEPIVLIATILAGVCSRWRAVALSTPRLWSHIKFAARDHTCDSAANLISLFLSRSGIYPLRIQGIVDVASDYKNHSHDPDEFDYSDEFDSPDEFDYADEPDEYSITEEYDVTKHIQPLVDVLAASVHRWQHIHIACSRSFLQRVELAAGPSWLLPMLERLEIQIHGQSESDQLRFFAQAPRLRHVCMPAGFDSLAALPWDQISSWLCYDRWPLRKFIALLHRCPNLGRCSGTSDSALSMSFATSGAFVRHGLRSLQMPFEGRRVFEDFFGSFDLPSLLDLRVPGECNIWSQSIFSDFLLRSSCTLQRLVLASSAVGEGDFLLILGSVPSLTGFEFKEEVKHFNTHVVERLTFTPENPIPLLPNLHTLSLFGLLHFDTRTFAKMVASRTTPNTAQSSTLQSVFLHYLHYAEVAKMTEPLREVQDLLGERADIRNIENMPRQSLAFPELL